MDRADYKKDEIKPKISQKGVIYGSLIAIIIIVIISIIIWKVKTKQGEKNKITEDNTPNQE